MPHPCFEASRCSAPSRQPLLRHHDLCPLQAAELFKLRRLSLISDLDGESAVSSGATHLTCLPCFMDDIRRRLEPEKRPRMTTSSPERGISKSIRNGFRPIARSTSSQHARPDLGSRVSRVCTMLRRVKMGRVVKQDANYMTCRNDPAGPSAKRSFIPPSGMAPTKN